ncbi:MAG: hypothetical protein GX664_04140 [Bacteroidales bacterium]|nr:hypothetical protein [Bacteroidales bacterium]
MLEQIKDAIAHELGLTDDYMDGTYLYYLTRCKSAFAVGTMTLEDFKEIDEELLDNIFNAIEPFFIEQAERIKELELEIKDWRAEVQKWQQLYKESEMRYLETSELLHLTISENQRYKQVLEEISNADCSLEGLDAERELDRITDIALKVLEDLK